MNHDDTSNDFMVSQSIRERGSRRGTRRGRGKERCTQRRPHKRRGGGRTEESDWIWNSSCNSADVSFTGNLPGHNKILTLIFQENHINNPFSLHLTYYHVDTTFYKPNNTKLALSNVLGKDSGTQYTRVLAP